MGSWAGSGSAIENGGSGDMELIRGKGLIAVKFIAQVISDFLQAKYLQHQVRGSAI